MKHSRLDNSLVKFTLTYKLLFVPYVCMYNDALANDLYQSDLGKALVNVYPAWDEKEETVEDGVVYLAFDLTKVSDISAIRRLYLDYDCITSMEAPVQTGRPEDSTNRFLILTVRLPNTVCKLFAQGKYSEMFDIDTLEDNIYCFAVNKGGFDYPLSNVHKLSVSECFHILTRSDIYAKVLAIRLAVPAKDVSSKLEQWEQPIDLLEETLNIDYLTKQIEQHGTKSMGRTSRNQT